MKKKSFLFLVLVIIAIVTAIFIFPKLNDCSNNTLDSQSTKGIKYETSSDNKTATVTGYSGSSTDARIANTYKGCPVTSINSNVFQFNEELTSICLGNNVTSIKMESFVQCYNLKSIVIPKSCTSIGNAAFYCCDSLSYVYYTGTEEDWNKINIRGFNYALTDHPNYRYYYSETQPTTSGKYWHYIGGVPTKW